MTPHSFSKASNGDASLALKAGFGCFERVWGMWTRSVSVPPASYDALSFHIDALVDPQMPRRCHHLPWWAGAASSSWARVLIPVPLTLCESHQLMGKCLPSVSLLDSGLIEGIWRRAREEKKKHKKLIKKTMDREREFDKEHMLIHSNNPEESGRAASTISHRCRWSTIKAADGTDRVKVLGWGECGRLRQGSLSPLSTSHGTSTPSSITTPTFGLTSDNGALLSQHGFSASTVSMTSAQAN